MWLLELEEAEEGDTWIHFFFHFLTGPVNTVAGPYRVEDRPSRAPTPSITDQIRSDQIETPQICAALLLARVYKEKKKQKLNKNLLFLLKKMDLGLEPSFPLSLKPLLYLSKESVFLLSFQSHGFPYGVAYWLMLWRNCARHAVFLFLNYMVVEDFLYIFIKSIFFF